jgi:rubrerythrin
MSAQLDVNEILDFAIFMEQKGYEFYTESAKKFNNLKLTQLFHLLAEQELTHENIFKNMKDKAGSLALKTDDNDGIYLKDYLDGYIFGKSKSLREKVKNLDNIKEVIQMAFAIEKDSVVFYSILKMYAAPGHEAVLEDIIQEELSHVLRLQKYKTEEIPPPPDVDAL